MNETFKKLVKVAGVMLVLAGIAGIFADGYVLWQGSRNIYSRTEQLPESRAVLVLGAAVWRHGQMSDVFFDRASTALAVYRAGKAEKILVSGDHSRGDYDEVNIAKKFFLDNNVPQEDIFVDYAGFDTYDSVCRAKKIFKVDSMIVSTQKFHLPRALFAARALGIEAAGITADLRQYNLGFYNFLRENAARAKTFWEVSFAASPRYLGEAIPISGDGRASWD